MAVLMNLNHNGQAVMLSNQSVHFVSRVGLDYVKKRVLADVQGRRDLWDRLQFAIEGDPIPGTSRRAPASIRASSFPLSRCRTHRPAAPSRRLREFADGRLPRLDCAAGVHSNC
jgi:hypothetical protein